MSVNNTKATSRPLFVASSFGFHHKGSTCFVAKSLHDQNNFGVRSSTFHAKCAKCIEIANGVYDVAARGNEQLRVSRGFLNPPERVASPSSRVKITHCAVDFHQTREVRDLANLDRLAALPRLVALLAARTAGLLNTAELSRAAGIPQTTLQRYLTLLEHVFLLIRIPAWHANLGKRLVRSPKLHLVDSGLACHALGLSTQRLERDPMRLGPLLESFVGMELVKQASWSERSPRVHHFRTSAGREVDFVLEDRAGSVAAIEVKAGATVGPNDFAGLRLLESALGERFARGVVLYRGATVVPFGKRLAAWPVESLWA